MLEVDDDVIKSEAGVKAVIQKMGQYYGRRKETTAWHYVQGWYNGKRSKGESAEQYSRVFMQRYAMIRA